MTDRENQDLSDRRAKLDAALAQKKSKTEEKGKNSASSDTGWGAAVKISSEFIGGVLVGAGIGYLLDSFAGTAPWGMIVFLMLGFAAGILNILRATGKVAEPDNRMSVSTSDDVNNIADGGDNKKQGD